MLFEKLLVQAKARFDFSIFHYCLMHTHFHLVVGMQNVERFSQGMRQIKLDYTRKYNQAQKRRGPLWQSRYKSLLIENDTYLFACGLYVEENPVRAGFVPRAEGWEYSSRRHYNGQGKNPLITDYAACERVLPEIDSTEPIDFERGCAVGTELFKFKLRKGL